MPFTLDDIDDEDVEEIATQRMEELDEETRELLSQSSERAQEYESKAAAKEAGEEYLINTLEDDEGFLFDPESKEAQARQAIEALTKRYGGEKWLAQEQERDVWNEDRELETHEIPEEDVESADDLPYTSLFEDDKDALVDELMEHGSPLSAAYVGKIVGAKARKIEDALRASVDKFEEEGDHFKAIEVVNQIPSFEREIDGDYDWQNVQLSEDEDGNRTEYSSFKTVQRITSALEKERRSAARTAGEEGEASYEDGEEMSDRSARKLESADAAKAGGEDYLARKELVEDDINGPGVIDQAIENGNYAQAVAIAQEFSSELRQEEGYEPKEIIERAVHDLMEQGEYSEVAALTDVAMNEYEDVQAEFDADTVAAMAEAGSYVEAKEQQRQQYGEKVNFPQQDEEAYEEAGFPEDRSDAYVEEDADEELVDESQDEYESGGEDEETESGGWRDKLPF